MRKVLIIGKCARVDCIADALTTNKSEKELYGFSEFKNIGLIEKCEDLRTGDTESVKEVIRYAHEVKPDFVIVGSEEPLDAGVVDALTKQGVPCVGPTKALAQLESSKAFTRNLLSKYEIPGNLKYRAFKSSDGLESYLKSLGEFVVKPDGLTGGKGVKIHGEHLHSIADGLRYSEELFEAGHEAVVIEEKLIGEEFSFQSFCDGWHVVDTIPVQDHKRAFDGDTGPNTGGMGSYSCQDHLLPFLSRDHVKQASRINRAVAQALREEFGAEYKGILYGGFMATKSGIRVLEYNARFGDPEVMNILPLLKADFMDICEAIINGTLDKMQVVFEEKATVCKYVVPENYPDKNGQDKLVDVPETLKSSDRLKIYYAAVDKQSDGLYLTGSRAIACVGIGDTLKEAEQIAEKAAGSVRGPVRHRKDIGTDALVQKRMDHMREILGMEESFSQIGTVGAQC